MGILSKLLTMFNNNQPEENFVSIPKSINVITEEIIKNDPEKKINAVKEALDKPADKALEYDALVIDFELRQNKIIVHVQSAWL